MQFSLSLCGDAGPGVAHPPRETQTTELGEDYVRKELAVNPIWFLSSDRDPTGREDTSWAFPGLSYTWITVSLQFLFSLLTMY